LIGFLYQRSLELDPHLRFSKLDIDDLFHRCLISEFILGVLLSLSTDLYSDYEIDLFFLLLSKLAAAQDFLKHFR